MSEFDEKAAAPQNGHIFIVGVGRSGTTLMRVLLDAHCRICCGPEMKMLAETSALYQSLSGRKQQLDAYHIPPADLRRHFRSYAANYWQEIVRFARGLALISATPLNGTRPPRPLAPRSARVGGADV